MVDANLIKRKMLFDTEGWESRNSKLSQIEIEKVENSLGIKFPLSYLNLMKTWNGGDLEDGYVFKVNCPVPEKLHYYLGDGFWEVQSIAGVSTSLREDYSIMQSSTTAHDWGISKEIIAFDGDGHTWLAFDYRERNFIEPPIIFIESDNYKEVKLFDSFYEFLSGLIPYNEVLDLDGNIIYGK
ncbi:SMI1/KNR4 family protein [Aestuariibacter sp. AA17]|uniref:SMI1/KNR4 family protein n=1 Tax=Fluctibacter corallii TaxID=2984329 RepID=A0ABT3A7Z6_9ALTE|nr:SMI1/KNR4 family protein [Aestuariibacter sp. AA17]MCV2884702.1 SMI1/KNR4 family protein [Aestuariibacter sp. AA17]